MASYLSFPYPPAGAGYWGEVTSTINWCEEDYYATPYSAEIINTLTNIWFMYLAWKGISSCLRNSYDRVFLYGFLSYLMIGLGSFFFHSSLKYSMQLLDELSMVYTTCIMFYAIYSHQQSPRVQVIIGSLIALLAVTITLVYHYLGDPLFHQNAFALLTVMVVFRSMYVMEINLRPSRKMKNGESVTNLLPEQRRQNSRDVRILKTMWHMIYLGVGSVGMGFLIWNLDNEFCSTLRVWRRQVGLPWGILLEGHGWWHIFTGIAEYFNLTWSIWLRFCLEGKQDQVKLVWPSLLSIPIVERTTEADVTNGDKND